ncbi:unnamed protein product [Gadus morhua 'NCC']
MVNEFHQTSHSEMSDGTSGLEKLFSGASYRWRPSGAPDPDGWVLETLKGVACVRTRTVCGGRGRLLLRPVLLQAQWKLAPVHQPCVVAEVLQCRTARYCNASCQRRAWFVHKRECVCLRDLLPRAPTDSVRLAARILFTPTTGLMSEQRAGPVQLADMLQIYLQPECFVLGPAGSLALHLWSSTTLWRSARGRSRPDLAPLVKGPVTGAVCERRGNRPVVVNGERAGNRAVVVNGAG